MHPSLNFAAPGDFWRDFDILALKFYMKPAVYNQSSFSKIYHYRHVGFYLGIPWVLANHKLSVNGMQEIDNAAGSYLNGLGNIITISDYAFFGLGTISEGYGNIFSDDPEADATIIDGGWNQFTHKPVVTALAINRALWPSSGSMSVDLHGLKLMAQSWEDILDPDEIIQSRYYGYPHLGRPSDHFQVTPFEAIYIDDKINNHIVLRYAGIDERTEGNKFLLNEIEPWHLGLQNQQVGSQAHPSYTYRVKRRARNTITLGKHVTPVTDDGDYVILPNADVVLEAGESITFTNGFWIQQGAVMQTDLEFGDCVFRRGTTDKEIETVSSDEFVDDKGPLSLFNREEKINLYPNPGTSMLTIFSEEDIHSIRIFTLSGLEMKNYQVGAGKEEYFITHQLSKGSYFVHLLIEGKVIVKQFVVL